VCQTLCQETSLNVKDKHAQTVPKITYVQQICSANSCSLGYDYDTDILDQAKAGSMAPIPRLTNQSSMVTFVIRQVGSSPILDFDLSKSTQAWGSHVVTILVKAFIRRFTLCPS
jgi:hypothetical protein